jgi:hypothetical protein
MVIETEQGTKRIRLGEGEQKIELELMAIIIVCALVLQVKYVDLMHPIISAYFENYLIG